MIVQKKQYSFMDTTIRLLLRTSMSVDKLYILKHRFDSVFLSLGFKMSSKILYSYYYRCCL